MFVYQRQGPSWASPQVRFIANPAPGSCRFAYTVALYGNHIAVTCMRGSRTPPNATAVYLYDVNTLNLLETFVPSRSNEAVSASLALSDTTIAFSLIVSATNQSSSSSVEVRDISSGALYHIAGNDYNFARSLALNGSSLLIGNSRNASLYSYSSTLNDYELRHTFRPGGPNAQGTYATSLAIHGNRVLIGAPNGVGKDEVW